MNFLWRLKKKKNKCIFYMSKIYLKELEKPNVKPMKMKCDKLIDKKLLNHGDMVSDVFSFNSYNIVVGSMGSGKSTLVTSWCDRIFRGCFENIYVFIPESSRKSMSKDIFGEQLPAENVFDELTVDNIADVYERLQENSKECENSLLIIDDFGSILKQKDIIYYLKRIVTKYRHLRCTIFLLQQNFFQLDKSLREVVSNIITFNAGKSQLEKVFNEIVQLPRIDFEKIIDLAFQEPHDWILINLNKSKKIYRNYDEIVVDKFL